MGVEMITFIAIGCLAFIFLYIFDFNKVIFIHRICYACFAAGVALLVVATMGILLGDVECFRVPYSLRVLFGMLSTGSLIIMIYSLFFALPFAKTYIKIEKKNKVIDTGIYALCRHPGVIGFFFFYLFLWLASGNMLIMWAGLIWTAMDVIHVYLQDRWFFPKTLNDYNAYKRKVPFLIPTRNSFKQCIATLPTGGSK